MSSFSDPVTLLETKSNYFFSWFFCGLNTKYCSSMYVTKKPVCSHHENITSPIMYYCMCLKYTVLSHFSTTEHIQPSSCNDLCVLINKLMKTSVLFLFLFFSLMHDMVTFYIDYYTNLTFTNLKHFFFISVEKLNSILNYVLVEYWFDA